MVVKFELAKMAAKRDTTVQGSVSTFVRMKPPDTFNEKWGYFPALFVEKEPGKPKHDILLPLVRVFSSLT